LQEGGGRDAVHGGAVPVPLGGVGAVNVGVGAGAAEEEVVGRSVAGASPVSGRGGVPPLVVERGPEAGPRPAFAARLRGMAAVTGRSPGGGAP